jgi:hypothetical protein
MIDETRIEFDLIVEPEEIEIEGNASAWGDGTDEPYWAEIRERVNTGDVWAWAFVTVVARYPGLDGIEGRDSLGCCSYKDEADFRQEGGYYAEMCETAKADLLAQIESIRAVIA